MDTKELLAKEAYKKTKEKFHATNGFNTFTEERVMAAIEIAMDVLEKHLRERKEEEDRLKAHCK